MLEPTMPKNVARFERLAYLSIALNVASMPLNWSTVSKYLTKSPVAYPLAIVVVFFLMGLGVWLIARKRKNWVRWTFLVLAVLGLPQAIWDMGIRFRTGPAAAAVFYLVYLMWLVAISFLFTRDARTWFKPHTEEPGDDTSASIDVGGQL